MGRLQAEQPLVGEKGIGPALMVRSSSTPSQSLAFPKQAAKPHSYPAVDVRERRLVAVLEVFKPASKSRVQIQDDSTQALAGGPPRLRSDCVSKLAQALLSRVATPLLESIAQKVKAVFLRVDDPRLLGVQRQAGLRPPFPG